MSSSDSTPIGRFGKYLVYSESCQGGMGTIYRAKDAGLEAWVAIKCLRMSALDGGSDGIKAFGAEALAMKRLDHANVVRLLDYGKEKNIPFLVMEWVDGKSLRETLARARELDSQLPLRLCLHVIQQAALGLQYVHQRGVIHRDLTPHNVMIGFDGSVKIIDFGIAKTLDSTDRTRTGLIKGKPGYLSPEQVLGGALTPRSDIFTLGILLWESLTGGRLFRSENSAETLKKIASCSKHIKPPSRYRPEISPELDRVALKALAEDPERRYGSAIELHDDLVRCAGRDLEVTIDHLDLERAMAGFFREAGEGKRTLRSSARRSEAHTRMQGVISPEHAVERATDDAPVVERVDSPEQDDRGTGSVLRQDIRRVERVELAISPRQLHRLKHPDVDYRLRKGMRKAADQSKIWASAPIYGNRLRRGAKSRRSRRGRASSWLLPIVAASIGVCIALSTVSEKQAMGWIGRAYSAITGRSIAGERPIRQAQTVAETFEQAILARPKALNHPPHGSAAKLAKKPERR